MPLMGHVTFMMPKSVARFSGVAFSVIIAVRDTMKNEKEALIDRSIDQMLNRTFLFNRNYIIMLRLDVDHTLVCSIECHNCMSIIFKVNFDIKTPVASVKRVSL